MFGISFEEFGNMYKPFLLLWIAYHVDTDEPQFIISTTLLQS